MDLVKALNNVTSQETLSEFIQCLMNDYSVNKDCWGNCDMASFLEAMSAWVTDMDGYYKNTDQHFDDMQPSWKNFADILMASRVYE
mgnify:CR=1 FL=1